MIEMMGEYTNVLEKHLGRLERLLKKNEVDKESVLEAGVSRSKSMDNLSSGRLATFTDTVRMTKDTVSNYGVERFRTSDSRSRFYLLHGQQRPYIASSDCFNI